MNYIAEVNAFKNWCRVNYPSTGAIVLWRALHDINNELGWPMRFKAPIETIKPLTGLSESGIKDARNSLKNYGLIDFENGKGRRAGYYMMVQIHQNSSTKELQSDHKEAEKELQSDHKEARSLNINLNKHQPDNAAGGSLIDIYHNHFVNKYGIKPSINGAKDGAIFKRLEKANGREIVERCLELYFADSDQFVNSNGHSVGVFSTRFNGYLVKATQKSFETAGDQNNGLEATKKLANEYGWL